jgi:integrase
MAAGIEERNGKRGTKWRAYVWSSHDRRMVRRTFDSRAAARSWLVDARKALKDGRLRAGSPTRFRDAAEAWLSDAEAGLVRNRSGRPFKPSTLRGYRRALALRAYPTLGDMRLSDIRRRDLQRLADGLMAAGQSASTVRNAIDPIRSIYRRAVRDEEVPVNPTHDLELPADDGRRDRVATPAEARRLLDALPGFERAIWATALYTGMRRGELRELRWSDVDLDARVIRVERALDDAGGIIATKTSAGVREVPILTPLRRELLSHRLRTGRRGSDLVLGRDAVAPFIPSTVRRRAIKAWRAAGLEPIALHECRHTAATEMRAAGLDFKMIQAIIGHSSVTTTFDRYTHVSREHLRQAADQLDAYYAAREKLGRNDA